MLHVHSWLNPLIWNCRYGAVVDFWLCSVNVSNPLIVQCQLRWLYQYSRLFHAARNWFFNNSYLTKKTSGTKKNYAPYIIPASTHYIHSKHFSCSFRIGVFLYSSHQGSEVQSLLCDLVPDSDNVSTIMWVLATPKIFQTLMGKIWRERGGGWGLPYTWLKQFYLPRYRNLNSLQRKEKFCFEKTKKKSEYTLVTSTNFPWRTMWNNLNIVA